MRYIENKVVVVHPTHVIRRVSVKKTHCNTTLHLAVKINQTLIEGLVDIIASMSVMAVLVSLKNLT